MSLENHSRLRPRFGRVKDALAYAPVGRSRLYQWGRERPGLFRKNGAASIIDFDVLDQILQNLPVADLKKARE
jgi:hypothetical protein